jgi:hypothetical protein
VYGRTLAGLSSAFLRIASDSQQGPDHVLELSVEQDGFVSFSVGDGPGEVPLTPLAGGAPRWVQLAGDASGGGGSAWMPALEVHEAGSSSAPLLVAGEEDPSCGGAGTECTHSILPGQTWQGEWGEPGDQDGFSFVAGPGRGPATLGGWTRRRPHT